MKKPRLLYYEEGENAWIPAPDHVENLIDVAESMTDGEVVELRFKRFDMTDEEFDSLPES